MCDMKAEVNTDPFIFRWKLNEAGYQWAEGIDRKPRLIPRLEPGKGSKPIELQKTVFAEFALMEPTEESIQKFADTYGTLFGSYDVKDSVLGEGGIASGGTSLDKWRSAIGDMRVLFDLWEDIENSRIAELKKVIRWRKTPDGDSSVSYLLRSPTRRVNQMLAHSKFSKATLIRFTDDRGVLLAARCALREEVNQRLAEHPTVPSLVWTPDYDERIVFKPPHLLAGLWLQFAQAITGEFGIKRCLCGKFLQIGPGGRRADIDACSPACRQRKKRKPLEP